ncbi:TetR/AcrR family transcriptional regulator [Paenibacillus thermoaerophilus]|nr:TetR/AcrR family transcriptional regulator [Paenibacillus thermoaerophilus]TMV04765.1 TetR/AcrR family transcriptional regulator [Paenibacillus thermoaerophilus]
MPPKVKFSKEAIIAAAFEIARTEGMDHITIRKVAEKMGSSIAPIYVNFKDVDELKQAVLLKIRDVSRQMLMTQYDPDPFLNIGIASLKFAREHPVLFKDLIMNNSRYIKEVQPPIGHILEQMKQAPELDGFNDEERMGILFKMQVFQLGLSVMDVTGMLPEHFNEERMIRLLESTGNDVIAAARLRKNGDLTK